MRVGSNRVEHDRTFTYITSGPPRVSTISRFGEIIPIVFVHILCKYVRVREEVLAERVYYLRFCPVVTCKRGAKAISVYKDKRDRATQTVSPEYNTLSNDDFNKHFFFFFFNYFLMNTISTFYTIYMYNRFATNHINDERQKFIFLGGWGG